MMNPIVRMSGIGKSFGGVPVLRGVDLEIHSGEVHVLAGENGAGKSTLMKILAGVYPDYEGSVELDGARVQLDSPAMARALGIGVIYQELSLVPSMTVVDNLFLGRFLCSRGFVSDRRQRDEAQAMLADLGIELDCARLAGELPVSSQQMIEIAKVLGANARVVVMDEPTSALNAVETERLFQLIERLKSRGCGIVYISHKMEEIYRVADRITVLRDGERVRSASAAEMPLSSLIECMVGRSIDEQIHRAATQFGDEQLRVESFSVKSTLRGRPDAVSNVSLSVRAGEILGVAGLQGSGNSEFFWGIFGAMGDSVRGALHVAGKPVGIHSVHDAIQNGIALLTNDRKGSGLVLSLPVIANITLADLQKLSPRGWRDAVKEREVAESAARSVRLRAASIQMEAGHLSGGNQQKVALAKWILTKPRVLLLDDPTRGVDVGAKAEIYQLMNEWTAAGASILLISSEMPELLGMSDRVIVMHRGVVTAEFARNTATPQLVLAAAMGQQPTAIS